MTLVEALNTNKAIRRKHWADNHYIEEMFSSGKIHTFCGWIDDYLHYEFSIQDIKATDWEVKNDTVKENT